MNSASTYKSDFTIGSLIFYLVIAFVFFFIGKNFDRIRNEVRT